MNHHIEEYEATIKKLDEEIARIKLWLNQSSFHTGTSVNLVARRYRQELKLLRKELWDNLPELY